MSRLTDQISYLRGLAAGMKLNPEKDSHRLILGILEVLSEVGISYEALAESQGELQEYVDAIDADLADLESELLDDDDEEAYDPDEDGDNDFIEYECPFCGKMIQIDPEDVDFDEDALCPYCRKELFPELPADGTEKDGEPDQADQAEKADRPEDGKPECEGQKAEAAPESTTEKREG